MSTKTNGGTQKENEGKEPMDLPKDEQGEQEVQKNNKKATEELQNGKLQEASQAKKGGPENETNEPNATANGFWADGNHG